jgi:protein-L-isoaspartate(D-aspartate) O-methyltransferase
MSDPSTRLNAALEGRYTIERGAGEGVAATGNWAKDPKHKREVGRKLLLAVVVALSASCGPRPPDQASASASSRQQIDFQGARRQMVEQQIEARGVTDPRVLEAMRRVPRHKYVPAEYRASAYSDRPLPIGLDQTISQPYIVALMTELIQPEPDDRILEIGTGSGYQAAVAAELVSEVYSIEIIPELAHSAAERLERLGVSNVVVRAGDGYLGWPEQSPFDGILVTAGAEHIPEPLVEQLKPGARMIIPVGDVSSIQILKVVEKLAGGEVEIRDIISVRFVPLRRNEKD